MQKRRSGHSQPDGETTGYLTEGAPRLQSFGALLVLDATTLRVQRCTADAPSLLGSDAQTLLGDSVCKYLTAAASKELTLFQHSSAAVLETVFALPALRRHKLAVILRRFATVLVVELLHGLSKLPARMPAPSGEQVARGLGGCHRLLAQTGTVPQLCHQLAALALSHLGFAHVAVFRIAPKPTILAYVDSLSDDGVDPPDLRLTQAMPFLLAAADSSPYVLIADSESPTVPLLSTASDDQPADYLPSCLLDAPSAAYLEQLRLLGGRSLLALRLFRKVTPTDPAEALWGVLLCWDPRPQLPEAVTRAFAQSLGQLFAQQLSVMSVLEDTRLSELRVRSAIEASGEPICILDMLGNTVLANAALVKLTGLPSSALRSRYQLEALLDQPGLPQEISAGLRSGSGHWQGETHFSHANGELVPIAVRVDIITQEDHSVAGFVGVFHDLRPHRQAQADRAEMERRLQEHQNLDSLGVLAAGIAHDFNNLLTGILGNASLLRAEVRRGRLTDSYLAEIEDTALRAAELCKQMLAYAGKGQFTLRELAINELVEDALSLLGPGPPARQAVQLRLGAALPLVMGDPAQLRQVLGNLLRNAAEALLPKPSAVPPRPQARYARGNPPSDPGYGNPGGLARRQITVATALLVLDADSLRSTYGNPSAEPGEYVSLEVQDTGAGIPPEIQKRMFEPFFSTKRDGRGLGLSTALGVVRRHGGVLRVRTELGGGSSFAVLLPARSSP